MGYSYKISVVLASTDQNIDYDLEISKLVDVYSSLNSDYEIGIKGTSGSLGLGTGPTDNFLLFINNLIYNSALDLFFVLYYWDCTNIVVYRAYNNNIDKVYEHNYEQTDVGPLTMSIDLSESYIENDITDQFF